MSERTFGHVGEIPDDVRVVTDAVTGMEWGRRTGAKWPTKLNTLAPLTEVSR